MGLLRAGLAVSAVIPLALASDTVSIAVMEVVDNLFILVVPGAMDAGLGEALFWWSLAVALAIAFVVAVPVNRALIARGKGHAVVHQHHHHHATGRALRPAGARGRGARRSRRSPARPGAARPPTRPAPRATGDRAPGS